jgi:hypothetical protein
MKYVGPLSKELEWSRARLSELEADSPTGKLEMANRDRLRDFHRSRIADLAEQLRAQGATVHGVGQERQ